jgi:hypothetical protein
MISKTDAITVANKLGVKFDKFSFQEFLIGLNIELEHGLVSPETNVTDDDLEKTAKIALAHLNEYSNYYNPNYGLPTFEKFLESKLQNDI